MGAGTGVTPVRVTVTVFVAVSNKVAILLANVATFPLADRNNAAKPAFNTPGLIGTIVMDVRLANPGGGIATLNTELVQYDMQACSK